MMLYGIPYLSNMVKLILTMPTLHNCSKMYKIVIEMNPTFPAIASIFVHNGIMFSSIVAGRCSPIIYPVLHSLIEVVMSSIIKGFMQSYRKETRSHYVMEWFSTAVI